MASSATKDKFVDSLQTAVNKLIEAKLALEDLTDQWFKNSFNTGGTAIIDADVATKNLTAAKVLAGIVLAQQLGNLFGNLAVTQGDYEATVQQLRTT